MSEEQLVSFWSLKKVLERTCLYLWDPDPEELGCIIYVSRFLCFWFLHIPWGICLKHRKTLMRWPREEEILLGRWFHHACLSSLVLQQSLKRTCLDWGGAGTYPTTRIRGWWVPGVKQETTPLLHLWDAVRRIGKFPSIVGHSSLGVPDF